MTPTIITGCRQTRLLQRRAHDWNAWYALSAADIQKYPKCVISGSLGTWGDSIISRLDLIIFIDTPTDIRIERLKKRELERFGERILQGGDMYLNHAEFIEWAKNYETMEPPERCRKLHEDWLKLLKCKLLRVGGTTAVDELLKHIILNTD